MKQKKLIFIAGLALTHALSHSQNLNTNQEKGAFLSKCYAFGVHVMVNDSEATQEMKKRITKWAGNISGAAEQYISKSQFDNLVKKELTNFATTNDNNYLRKQANQCTSILGGW